MSKTPVDHAARLQALDPGRSVIVQAPAGSGKTELLIRRYLTLLATVEQPEEIVALTFTRKAAAEMRERALDALRAAQASALPDSSNESERVVIARRALERERQCGWALMANPARLRIVTIDSFNASLVRQMPLVSGMGRSPQTADYAGDIYYLAARRTVEQLQVDDTHSDALNVLLRYFDNRAEIVIGQLAGLLARREQWLGLVTPEVLADPSVRRQRLDQLIAQIAASRLRSLVDVVPAALTQIPPLARFAAERLRAEKSESVVGHLEALNALPGTQW
ncbi:MAG: UvrD-helicase domain-containing protein, partial [Pseudomonadota bacterium]